VAPAPRSECGRVKPLIGKRRVARRVCFKQYTRIENLLDGHALKRWLFSLARIS
jgi:hypothetical protein